MEEIWKTIEGFPNYEVSNMGNVKSLSYKKTGKARNLAPKIDRGGYYQVVLCGDNNSRGYKSVHTLVWDAFGSSPRNGSILQVDHVDNDKLNNRIENLQLLNTRENTSKAWRQKQTSSKYVGVSYDKGCNKWVSGIGINGKRVCIGYFDSEEEAATAYQDALKNIDSPEKIELKRKKPKYYCWHRAAKKWCVRKTINGERVIIGFYITEEEAKSAASAL